MLNQSIYELYVPLQPLRPRDITCDARLGTFRLPSEKLKIRRWFTMGGLRGSGGFDIMHA